MFQRKIESIFVRKWSEAWCRWRDCLAAARGRRRWISHHLLTDHCIVLVFCVLCFDVMVKLKGIWFEWWGGCADAGGLANLRQVNLFYRRLLLTLSSPSIITEASDSFASRSRGRGKSSLLMAKEGRKDTLFGFQWAGLRLTIMHTGNLENKL